MSDSGAPGSELVWGYTADLPVEKIAVAYGAGWTAAADGARNVYILDVQGMLRGEFQADYAVRSLAAGDDGLRFLAQAGPDTAYVFDAHGILQTEVVFAKEIRALAGDATLSRLVALCVDDTVVVREPQKGSESARELGWHPTSLAVANPDPLMIALADSQGQVALLDGSCSVRWSHRLRVPAGPVCSDGQGRVVALPAGPEGLLLFDPRDGSRESLVADEPIRRAAPLRRTAGHVVEMGTGTLVLLGGDGRMLWRRDLRSVPTDWAVGAEGRLLAVARGGREIAAYELPEAAAGVYEPTTEYLQIERAITGVPGVPNGEVAWSNELPAEVAEAGVGDVRVGARGDFAVLLSGEGAVVSYDMQGAAAGEGRVVMPTYLAPRVPLSGVVVWNMENMLVLEPGEGRRASRTFEPKTRNLACSDDLGLLCAVGVDGAVRAWAEAERPLWMKELDPPPTTVSVSPGGDLVVVRDQSRRFLYYTAEGRLYHKSRFSGGERLEVLAAADEFVVFGDRKGQVVVLTAHGEEMWSGRPLAGLRGVELLGECVAMYSRDRQCMLLYPSTGEVRRFSPPPGAVRIRLQPDGKPVLVHCADGVLTLYERTGRGLGALWQFELDAEVEGFEPDRTGDYVVLVAGGSIHAVRAPVEE